MVKIKNKALQDYINSLNTLVTGCTETISDEMVKEKAIFIQHKLVTLTEKEQKNLKCLRKYDEVADELDLNEILEKLQTMDSWIKYYQICIHANYIAKNI